MFELTPAQYVDALSHKLKELPDSPGVYLHRDADGNVIYVGKAVSLKNRVASYFRSPRNHPVKLRALVSRIADFSYVLVDSETEALTLESNLIKQYRPKYNILLKDDKTFPYVRMDMHAAYPRAEIVYKLKNDGARYFGPYLSRTAVRDSIEAVRDNFPLRTCKKDIEKALARGERPCLNYHIGKCIAPCADEARKAEYREVCEQVASFLSGKTDEVIVALTKQMQDAAQNMAFERAAVLRDRIEAIKTISEKQKAIAANDDERDIFALARLDDEAVVYGLFVRSGKVIGTESYELKGADEEDADVLASFLTQFYGEQYVPKEVLTAVTVTGEGVIADWLSEKRGTKVGLHSPARGDKKKLCDMAKRNGAELLEKAANAKKRAWERTEGALRDLATALCADELPRRIECYDISHTMGMEPVASMVVFEDGKSAPKEYRRFKIKGSGNDDYAAMTEVLSRRLERYIKEKDEAAPTGFSKAPDLLLIDGGKGQLNVALCVLQAHGLDFAAIGLSERLEEVWLPNEPAPLILERGTPALHLLQRIRDEAHRFAITYHRSLRNKASLASALEEIKGIGPKRRRALLAAFPSPDDIRKATEAELAAADGVDKRTAKIVYDALHGEEQRE